MNGRRRTVSRRWTYKRRKVGLKAIYRVFRRRHAMLLYDCYRRRAADDIASAFGRDVIIEADSHLLVVVSTLSLSGNKAASAFLDAATNTLFGHFAPAVITGRR